MVLSVEELIDAGGAEIYRPPILRKVPPENVHSGRHAGLAAQREHPAHERQLAGRQAVDEILAAAVDGVVYHDQVLAVLGHLESQHRVGMEAKVVDESQLVALGVVDRQHRLEPTGHGVGQIRDQLSGGQGEDELLPLLGGEVVAINVARHDLTVGDRRQRDARHLGSGGCRALLLFAELRQLTDVKDQRVREPGRRLEPQLPRTRFSVVGDRHADRYRLGDGRRGRVLRLAIAERKSLDARAGDVRRSHTGQVPPAHDQLELGPLPTPGRVDVSNPRTSLLSKAGSGEGKASGQGEEEG